MFGSYCNNNKPRRGKAKMIEDIIDIINYDHNEYPLLFNLYNDRGDVVNNIYGPTKQDIEKPKVVDVNIPGGALVLNEERNKIREIEDKYSYVWKVDVKEKRINAISKVKKETNWKLRVLNEQYYLKTEERENLEKDMRAASDLLFFSKSVHKEAAKKNKQVNIKESNSRRSARIAEKIKRKSKSE